MKAPSLKTAVLVSVWCITSAAAFWLGRTSTPSAPALVAKAPSHDRNFNDHGPTIALNAAKAAPSLQDLLNAKGKPNADALKAWADSLDPAQCPGLLADLQKMPGGQPRDALIEAMIGSWANRDPAGYLAAYNTVSSPRLRENGVGDALEAMAEQDPKSAAAWLAASTDAVPNQMLARRYRSAIEGMADSDPQAALTFVQGLDTGSMANGRIQRQGLNTIADALADQGRFSDALQMFSSLPDNQRGSATGELLSQWAQDSPTDATNYIATLTDPNQRGQAAAQVVQSWARTDPQAAAVWAAQYDQAVAQSTGQPSGDTLADAMRSWSRFDMTGPAQFLNSLPPSPDNDSAVATFTAQARTVDPSSAMAWVNQITDPTMRDRAAGSVAVSMLASGNIAALNQAISSNQISPAQAQWLSTLPTDNPQALNRISRRLGANFTTNTNRPAPWAPPPAQQQ